MLRRGRAGSAGFTLLEVLIAMAIMAVAFSAILSIQGNGIQATIKAHQLNTITMLARGQMVDAELAVQGKTFDEMPKAIEGNFEKPFEDYRWKREIKELKVPPLPFGSSAPGAAVDPMTEKLSKLFSQYLSDAIRLMTITIYYKNGKTDGSYSVSTYWVNLNQEFKFNE